MADTLEILEIPEAKEVVMIVGWRQWADAGSVSSELPRYLVKRTHARRIGRIRPDGFYQFQIPGTHDLVRPVIEFQEGVPASLTMPENQFYYFENSGKGVVVFLGDEPHMDAERYILALLEAAERLHVRRIIGLGGVYGEFPYNKERMVSGSFSLEAMRDEMEGFALNFTQYHGGASIGSVLCKYAGDRGKEYVGLYAMVPIFDFSSIDNINHSVQIENDYTAWLGLMRRINFMVKIDFDLSQLAQKSKRLIQNMDAKVEELAKQAPDANIPEYFQRLAETFEETPFIPLDDVWEDSIRKILDRMDDELD
ncbi:MAG: PAC2 family protein [Anaerolineae bacterium]|nr:PAC2 family protein [Anaerolineae bacterium]